MPQRPNVKKSLLYMLIVSVVLAAVLGIFVVLRGTWGWFELRVVLTTIILAVASVLGLACDMARTPRGWNLLSRSGMLLTLWAATLLLVGLWGEFQVKWYWKTAISSTYFAVATVHVCLLSLARLAGRYRWVNIIACQVIYGLALMLSAMAIWNHWKETPIRIVAAMAIVAAALSLLIPLLHRLSKTEAAAEHKNPLSPLNQRNLAEIDQEVVRLQDRIAKLRRLRDEIENGS